MAKEEKTAQELADMIATRINIVGLFIKVHADPASGWRGCEPRSERRGTAAFRRYGLVSGIDQVTIVVGYTPAATTAGADTIEKIGSEAVNSGTSRPRLGATTAARFRRRGGDR